MLISLCSTQLLEQFTSAAKTVYNKLNYAQSEHNNLFYLQISSSCLLKLSILLIVLPINSTSICVSKFFAKLINFIFLDYFDFYAERCKNMHCKKSNIIGFTRRHKSYKRFGKQQNTFMIWKIAEKTCFREHCRE